MKASEIVVNEQYSGVCCTYDAGKPSMRKSEINNTNGIGILSCSYLQNDEGKGIFIFGVPLKITGSDTVSMIHLAFDENKRPVDEIGKSLDIFYDQLRGTSTNRISLSVISQGSDKLLPEWNNLVSLLDYNETLPKPSDEMDRWIIFDYLQPLKGTVMEADIQADLKDYFDHFLVPIGAWSVNLKP